MDAAANTGNTPDWAALRREFPTTERFNYLDIARKAILPRCVKTAMDEWIGDVFENAGGHAFSMSPVEETRETVARVFGAPARNIALIKNTSEGVNIVAQGFEGLREGDNVVISVNEHENNTFPWRNLSRRGIETRFVEPDEEGRVTADHYRAASDARTRVIAVARVAYGNGYRADLAAISAFCREIGAKLVVDAIQSIGVLDERVDALGADAVIAGGHKAQFSVAGAGFMYMADDMIAATTPPYAAKFSFTSNDRLQPEPEFAPDAHRFEYGNPNFVGCWVQRRSAEFVERIGLPAIEARVRDLSTAMIEGAEARQIRVRTPLAWEERAGIVSFALPGSATAIVAALGERKIVVSLKDDFVRASVHFYNTEEEVEAFLDALREVAA